MPSRNAKDLFARDLLLGADLLDQTPRPTTPHPITAVRQASDAKRRPLVLLVDDDEDFLDMTKHALTQSFDIITAGDGETALAIFRQQRLDLVITDICMPKMSGFELIRALSQHAVPIIAVSGYEIIQRSYSGERSIIEETVAEIIRKPCSVSDIYEVAARILRRQNS